MSEIVRIIASEKLVNMIIQVCDEDLRNGNNDCQSFGVVSGRKLSHDKVELIDYYQFRSNFRLNDDVSEKFSETLRKHAYKGRLDEKRRGWMSDPLELMEVIQDCSEKGTEIIGGYHLHHTESWEGSANRELPSAFDSKLLSDKDEIMFIVCLHNEKSSFRAFHKGRADKEIIIERID